MKILAPDASDLIQPNRSILGIRCARGLTMNDSGFGAVSDQESTSLPKFNDATALS